MENEWLLLFVIPIALLAIVAIAAIVKGTSLRANWKNKLGQFSIDVGTNEKQK